MVREQLQQTVERLRDENQLLRRTASSNQLPDILPTSESADPTSYLPTSDNNLKTSEQIFKSEL